MQRVAWWGVGFELAILSMERTEKNMYKQNETVGLLGVISAIVLLAVSPARAADLSVNGNVTVNGNAVIVGKLGVGVTDPVANVQINQTGTGVGVFLGDRTPFGQALFETDVTAPATHAWFAENGNRVFSVTGGGGGFFNGMLEVGDDAFIMGRANLFSDTFMGASFSMGDLILGSTGVVQIFGERIFPSLAPTRFRIESNGDVGIGTASPTAKLHVAGNVAITGDESFGAQPRQMINLWNTAYGIGVQDLALYQRTADSFFWFKGGRHVDRPFGFPGDGGTQLMGLGNAGDLHVSGIVITPVLQITGGTDVAEPFTMSRENIPRGAVVIIDDENAGQLKLSEGAYDSRVAGIVSGANGINPGISLSQQDVFEGGQNVALSGRVYVLADASSNPIKPGDLLTTSDTPGHAMKVSDHARAQGAVIGKAMSALKEGKGMVLVLVSLQ
jgi:hypothetical protein